jgi:hypothetical protein
MAHLCFLCLITITHPICVFLSLADDTHIVDLTSNVVPISFYDCSMSFQHYTSKNLHIFNYNLQLIFCCKWHLQLKWLIVVLDKLHKTLIINDDLMMMSSQRQWMKYVFELIIFFICWPYNRCNYHAISDQFLMTNDVLPRGVFYK